MSCHEAIITSPSHNKALWNWCIYNAIWTICLLGDGHRGQQGCAALKEGESVRVGTKACRYVCLKWWILHFRKVNIARVRMQSFKVPDESLTVSNVTTHQCYCSTGRAQWGLLKIRDNNYFKSHVGTDQMIGCDSCGKGLWWHYAVDSVTGARKHRHTRFKILLNKTFNPRELSVAFIHLAHHMVTRLLYNYFKNLVLLSMLRATIQQRSLFDQCLS